MNDHSGDNAADPIPLRMLNEFAYCPRLFHLMHVEGRWADNVYTIDGRHAHRRVDKLDHVLPEAGGGGGVGGSASGAEQGGEGGGDATLKAAAGSGAAPAFNVETSGQAGGTGAGGDAPPEVVRSTPLGSSRWGLSGKLDLVSVDDSPADGGAPEAVPVETKRGRVPNNPERSYEPERVQLMAQGLLLREQGYRCDHGVLYFVESKTRVDVPFDEALERRTAELIEAAHAAARSRRMPPPLEDSPKCVGCSLAGICLPDETLSLQLSPPDPEAPSVRRLYPARDEAFALYVQEQGASVGKRGETLIVRKKGSQLAKVRIKDVSQLVLCGNVQISTQTVHQLCEAAVPVVYLSMGHWFYGWTVGLSLRNAFDRAAQFEAVNDARRCVEFARRIVADKGVNQRAVLRRNGSPPAQTLRDMADLLVDVERAGSIASLLGLEGNLARLYFQSFATTLRPRDLSTEWDFNGRNRRPPRDPINAMLSFTYALLVKECTVALLGEGLEPHWGLYHQPRHGRPALALDLMEPLRPLIADSAVVTALNTGMVSAKDFETGAGACLLKPTGRKGLIRSFEARLDQLVTHPAFDYRCSWRSAIRLQARLLARWLRGDVPNYVSITTR